MAHTRIPHYPVSSAVEAQAQTLRLLTRPPAGVDLFAGLTPGEWPRVVPHLRRLLAVAPAYYWSPPLGRVLEAMAPDFPLEWRLVPEALLTPNGWAWFDPPLTLPVAGRTPLRLAALLWGQSLLGAADVPSASFILWFAPALGSGPTLPWVVVSWPLGESLAACTQAAVGAYPAKGDAPALAVALRLLAGSLALASQQLVVAPAQPLDRHTRKRVVAGGVLPLPTDPTVRVVQLRRQRAATGGSAVGEHTAVEWSFQWVVRGHWRHQPYPSRGVIQPIWIHSYVKGPADKPLKTPPATVFAVVR